MELISKEAGHSLYFCDYQYGLSQTHYEIRDNAWPNERGLKFEASEISNAVALLMDARNHDRGRRAASVPTTTPGDGAGSKD